MTTTRVSATASHQSRPSTTSMKLRTCDERAVVGRGQRALEQRDDDQPQERQKGENGKNADERAEVDPWVPLDATGRGVGALPRPANLPRRGGLVVFHRLPARLRRLSSSSSSLRRLRNPRRLRSRRRRRRSRRPRRIVLRLVLWTVSSRGTPRAASSASRACRAQTRRPRQASRPDAGGSRGPSSQSPAHQVGDGLSRFLGRVVGRHSRQRRPGGVIAFSARCQYGVDGTLTPPRAADSRVWA